MNVHMYMANSVHFQLLILMYDGAQIFGNMNRLQVIACNIKNWTMLNRYIYAFEAKPVPPFIGNAGIPVPLPTLQLYHLKASKYTYVGHILNSAITAIFQVAVVQNYGKFAIRNATILDSEWSKLYNVTCGIRCNLVVGNLRKNSRQKM